MLSKYLGELMTFMAIVETGSFVAGGRSTGISRSAASKSLARLESRLGVRLMHRTTRALSLTDEGRVYYEKAISVVDALDDAHDSVAASAGTSRGVLRLTAPDTFGRHVVLPLLKRFLAEWPEVQAEVSFSDRPSDIIEEGFDLALRVDYAAPDTQLVSRVIARYERVLVAAPGYLSARGIPKDIDDLADHDALFFFSRGRRQSWQLGSGNGAPVKVQVSGRLRVDSGEALREAAVDGWGIALMPIFLVANELETGKLQRVLPHVVGKTVEISAIYPSKRLLEPRVRRFIDFIVASLEV